MLLIVVGGVSIAVARQSISGKVVGENDAFTGVNVAEKALSARKLMGK